MLIWNTYLCLIPFPVGTLFLFSNPDIIYQFCLSNNLLNVALPFLSLLTRLGRGFSCWAIAAPHTSSTPVVYILANSREFYSCCLERAFWKLLVPSVWTGISHSLLSLGKKNLSNVFYSGCLHIYPFLPPS